MGRKMIDRTGQVFGNLTVIKSFISNKTGRASCECICICGNKVCFDSQTLKNSKYISCGCLKYENQKKKSTKHGMSKTRLFKTWSHMKERCTCITHNQYSDYGGRGITVCEEWLNDFVNFYEWANNNGYDDSLTIDRIDVNGNYEPNNCRWTDSYTQQNNTRRTIKLEIDGQLKSLSDLSKEYRINKGTLDTRYRKGLRGKDLLKPVKDTYKKVKGRVRQQ